MVFLSDFLTRPTIDKVIPIPVSIIVIESPIKYPTFAIFVGSTKTIKKQTKPIIREI